MKKLVMLVIIISTLNVFAQDGLNKSPFTDFKLGAYGGINFVETSDLGGEALIEGKTNLLPNLNFKLSIGYYRIIEPVSYSVKSWGESTIDSIKYYYASKDNYIKHRYDVFPFSLGLQYIFNLGAITPYVSLDGSYNMLSPSVERNGGETWIYFSPEEIPEEFLNGEMPVLPSSTFGFSFGGGVMYAISSKVDLDFRYYYKYDSEIVNTHHLLVGIVF